MVKRTGAVHIAAGDLLRAELAKESDLGERARSHMEKGELVPDSLVSTIFEHNLARRDLSRGFIVDGFPRTIVQAEMLDRFLSEHKQNLEAVFDLKVEEELIIRRLSGRIICPACEAIYNVYTLPPKVEGKCDNCGVDLVQRKDDRPEAVAVRLRVYREQTEPLLKYYRPRSLLHEVNAGTGAESAADEILKALNSKRQAVTAKE